MVINSISVSRACLIHEARERASIHAALVDHGQSATASEDISAVEITSVEPLNERTVYNEVYFRKKNQTWRLQSKSIRIVK